MGKRETAEVQEREEATKLGEWPDRAEPRMARWDRVPTPPE